MNDFDDKMLCGSSTNIARVENITARIPQPRPENDKSIYEVQKSIKKNSFKKFIE